MPEEFLPGCQRPSVAEPALQPETESAESMKEAKRPKSQQLLRSTKSFKVWALKFFPSA